MEDIVRFRESNLVMDCMPLIPSIVKKLNGIRLGNKDKWTMGIINIVDFPSAKLYCVRLKYKMYNTWVQILELEVTVDGKISHIKDSSPMGMTPTAFKKWLKESLQSLLRSLIYDKVTN